MSHLRPIGIYSVRIILCLALLPLQPVFAQTGPAADQPSESPPQLAKSVISNLRELNPDECRQPYKRCDRAFDYISPHGVAEVVIEYPGGPPGSDLKIVMKKDETEGTVVYTTYSRTRIGQTFVRYVYIIDQKGKKSNSLIVQTEYK